MNIEYSEEHELLRENVRRFLEEAAPIAGYVREHLGAARGTSEACWKGLVELGLPGLLIPEASGGTGLSLIEMGLVLEEMGRVVHPGPFLISALTATRLVNAVATDAQRDQWLPAMAHGELRVSVALHERAARGDITDLRCEATRDLDADDERWRLSGTKGPVLDYLDCHRVLVIARDTDTGGLGVFGVEVGADGLACDPVESLDGTRKHSDLRFDDVDAVRLGDGGAAPAIAAAAQATAVGLVADGVGAAGRAFELAREYALARSQFDQPIGSFQAIQHMLVDMLRDLELGRAAVRYALWALEHAEAKEGARAAAMAKAFASEALPRLGANAIQIFGGVGFTWEMDIHLYYKRLISMQHLFGDAGEQLEVFAELQFD